jgi:hypothetical protein
VIHSHASHKISLKRKKVSHILSKKVGIEQ